MPGPETRAPAGAGSPPTIGYLVRVPAPSTVYQAVPAVNIPRTPANAPGTACRSAPTVPLSGANHRQWSAPDPASV